MAGICNINQLLIIESQHSFHKIVFNYLNGIVQGITLHSDLILERAAQQVFVLIVHQIFELSLDGFCQIV